MVAYTVRENPRARRITITVRRDGSVWVTKPRRTPLRAVEQFVHKSVSWIEKARKKIAGTARTSRIESSKKEFEKFKSAARHLVARRIMLLNERYGFRFSKIVIRNQKSRWGSCSHAGVLSFNYRLVFLPEHLADYVIVHELCHLAEMNHGKKFWALVAQAIPDHVRCRKEIRKYEHGLLID
ncbi:MAG TPA: SprT family zinc-dependent metalloprotease [Candidatus Paceibacterota bacterium]|nr:SprT family zinc-dependent metalloprotease [Candidatus Paceibacterota bacterium]